jgi:hypothetical protein
MTKNNTYKNKTSKNNTYKNKTLKNKTLKNKTLKNKIIYKKTKFIQNILNEWKKQTSGFIEKDKEGRYKNDYYLDLNNAPNYNNHIHLILHNFSTNHNTRDILCMMKKFNIPDEKVIHSKPYKVNINSDPKKVVRNMIQKYDQFINHNKYL